MLRIVSVLIFHFCITLAPSQGMMTLLSRWIGDSFVYNLASTVKWLVPYPTEFTVVGTIHRHDGGPFGNRRYNDAGRWIRDLIAVASLLVEHAVAVLEGLASTLDRCAPIRD